MNKLKDLIRSQETESFHFIPGKKFYEKIGVNRKRWAKIYRGELSPTLDEIKRISEHFGVSINELI
jgi:hypothetical protein